MRVTALQHGWGDRARNLPSRMISSWNQMRLRLSSRVLSDVPFVLSAVTVALTMLGLVMVLSASSIQQIAKGQPWAAQFLDQSFYTFMGLVIMLVLGFALPVIWVRNSKLLHCGLLVSVVLLVAVAVAGVTVNGNRNWIAIAGVTIQPSELIKPVMILWLARVYSRQGSINTGSFLQSTYKALVPAALGFGMIVLLIMLGHDAGTVVVYALFFIAIFVAATPTKRLMQIVGVILALGAAYVLLGSENRRTRLLNVLPFSGPCTDASCDQVNASLAALATGGFWGVGLGQSRQKYNYLPEAHNDFIFAIVGEELGLIGALAILLLYGMMIHCAMRIMLRSSDLFIKYASLGIITWFAGQGILNIGMAVGTIPVIGVPLPFVSYGGSAMISSLVAMGLLIAFARQTPLQPIMGDNGGTVQPATRRRLAFRRAQLLDTVNAEQAAIARDPYGSGWTWEKFLRFIGHTPGVASPRPASAGRPRTIHPAGESTRQVRPSSSTGRPSATTVRRAHQPDPAESMEASVSHRSSSTSGARPSASVQHAQQAYQRQQQEAQSAPAPAQQAPRASKPAPAPEPKLPAGLRTIRRARPLPGDQERES